MEREREREKCMRKRKSHPDDWTRNKRKASCQGKLYTSSHGVLKGPQVPVDIGDHTGCRFRCIWKIPTPRKKNPYQLYVLGKRFLDKTKRL